MNRRRIGKKLLSLVLAVLMGITMMSTIALAAGTVSVSYVLDKVYKGSTVYFDRTDTAKSNSSINKGYSADLTIYVTDATASEDDIWKDNGQGGKESQIQVNLDRGSFTFAATGSSSTIKSVTAMNGGGVKYTIKLTGLVYSGQGNTLGMTILSNESSGRSYLLKDDVTISQSVEYTPSVSIRDDKDDDDDDDVIAVATPYVIVSSYSYGGGQIVAGDTFNLTLQLYNTSSRVDVENMLVTIGMPEEMMLTSSSNTFYVSSLDSEETISKTVKVTAKPTAAPESHNVTIDMQYQYIDYRTNVRNNVTTKETLAIPVIQVDRFEVTGTELDDEFAVGRESLVTVNYVNKGRSQVYNISAKILGNIQNDGETQNLGNLASGSTGSTDFYVNPLEGGSLNCEIVITYEDTNMTEKTITVPITAEVIDYSAIYEDPNIGMDPGGMGDYNISTDPGMTTENNTVKMAVIVGVVLVVVIAAAVVIRRRIKKKRSEALDADL